MPELTPISLTTDWGTHRFFGKTCVLQADPAGSELSRRRPRRRGERPPGDRREERLPDNPPLGIRPIASMRVPAARSRGILSVRAAVAGGETPAAAVSAHAREGGPASHSREEGESR